MKYKIKGFSDEGFTINEIEKKVAGIVAINDFPMAPRMIRELKKLVDILVLRFDEVNGDTDIWLQCIEAASGTKLITFTSDIKWNRWNWREELLRELDDEKPDIILSPDEDETFHEDFLIDLKKFMVSSDDIMMFSYKMITDDGRHVMKYPNPRHCKAYKWVEGIGYKPYKYCAKPTLPGDREPVRYIAEYPMLHYCFYTKELEESKVLHK